MKITLVKIPSLPVNIQHCVKLAREKALNCGCRWFWWRLMVWYKSLYILIAKRSPCVVPSDESISSLDGIII